jgi:hypothetical protein
MLRIIASEMLIVSLNLLDRQMEFLIVDCMNLLWCLDKFDDRNVKWKNVSVYGE